MKRIITLLVTISCVLGQQAKGDELDVLTKSERATANEYARMQQSAYEALARRREAYEKLKTPEEIKAYQKRLKAFFLAQLGGFPERTPLNAQTVRTIQADGYRIENVIFESVPNHHITANLYLPDSKTKVPGIAVASGHSRTGKTADYNQRFGIMMAKQGMAALCFDPIGQGERSQILDKQGEIQFQSTVTEHFLVGVGSILVGRNTARYRVWDAMRAIDYLASREEVDAERIGFTGCSGGGTVTSYVMALDERVTCAAPACYLTTFKTLLDGIGPQDAEQNIFGQIEFGLDHPDYVILRAPRPTLMSTTSGDYFASVGTWDNLRQAKRIYARLGYPERVDLVEVEGKHGVQPQNLATIAHWMRRWLLGKDEPVEVVLLPVREPKELLCTNSGQVLSTFDAEKTVFDLNSDYEKKLAKQRTNQWKAKSMKDQQATVRKLLRVRKNEEMKPPKFEDRGRITREDFHIDKLLLTTDTGALLPGLTFHPPSPLDDAYLYLHEDGKLGDAKADGPIEQLLSDGYAVVTIDLRGQGEAAAGKRDPLLSDWKTFYMSYLMGQPLLGTRVEDALAAADFVAYYQKKRTSPRKVHLIGVGQAGMVALHAAALNPELFASVTVKDSPESWAAVVGQDIPAGQLDSTVHGVLKHYDLPDLARLLGGKYQIEKSKAE